jgi:hypothetical protein
MTFNCQSKGFMEESGKKMQAEGGFGHRRFLSVALPARLSLDLNYSPTSNSSACT